MIALVVIAVWVTAVLPSVLASGILVQIANGAALAWRSMRAERQGRETVVQRLETEIVQLRTVVQVCQALLLMSDVDKRRIPLMPGQAPLDFMEDADRPDLG